MLREPAACAARGVARGSLRLAGSKRPSCGSLVRGSVAAGARKNALPPAGTVDAVHGLGSPLKLVPRLTLWFMVSIAVLLSARGLLRVRQQSQAFDADMQRDHRFIGRGLAGCRERDLAGWRATLAPSTWSRVAGHTADASIELSVAQRAKPGHGELADSGPRERARWPRGSALGRRPFAVVLSDARWGARWRRCS